MAKRKRRKKQKPPPRLGTDQYVKAIIKHLERVKRDSGRRPPELFEDWLQMVEATLAALPAHLKALVRTGQLAPDPPETAERLARIRARYEAAYGSIEEIWTAFGRAFGLLLESAGPGLWAYVHDPLGPDVLGQIYQTYVYPPGSSRHNGTYYTPWPVALTLARLNMPDGARLVHERLKQACQHPDNLLAQATLLAGLAIDDPQEARTWFFNQVLPAGLRTYRPIRIGDPAGVGSGILLLAAATVFPEWAVLLNLVTFGGVDNDLSAVHMARINCALYGLNGYFLKFVPALQMLQANDPALGLPPRSATEAYQQALKIYQQRHAPNSPARSPSFEELFKQSTTGTTA